MATPQERMRDWLLSQVGYVADGYKRTKYGEMLDSIGFYNGPKNGYDWCDQFYDAGLVENFGEQTTYKMTGQFKGCGGAGCWLSAGYYRDIGRWSDEPSIGAQIFFGEYGDEGHTGGVVAFDATTVTTVEGNTDYSLGYSTGRVGKHTWSRWDSRIVGYGIPNWSLVDPIEQEPGDAKNDLGMTYRAHTQDLGWLPAVRDGQTAGIVGHSLRCEAIKITPPEGVVLDCFAHVQDIGTLGYPSVVRGKSSGTGSSDNDPIIGTTGRGKRLEAIMLRCVENGTGKKLRIQAHVQDVGWQKPVGEGEWAGTLGKGKRLEAVRMWFE